MNIDVSRELTLEQVETILAGGASPLPYRLKKEKDSLKVLVNSLRGADVRLVRTDKISQVQVNPFFPLTLPLEIILFAISFYIYQTYGRLYGIIAILALAGVPYLLGRILSGKTAAQCADILTRALRETADDLSDRAVELGPLRQAEAVTTSGFPSDPTDPAPPVFRGSEILIPPPTSQAPPPPVCPACHQPVDVGWLHCGHCGSPLVLAAATPAPEPARTPPAPRPMPPMPAAPPKLRRPPGKAWGLILAGIGVLLFILAVQVAGDRMNPEEKAEDVPAGSPLVQDNAAAILPTRPASSPAEPTPQAVLPILGQTPSAPLNPVSAEERGKAEGYFASGASVYLYDPQPLSTELSVLESTLFSARYILAKDSESIPNVVFIWKVNPAGEKEYVVSDRGYIEDWGNETGQITFSVFNILRDTNRQNMAYDPNQAVLQGMLGMSTLYGPMNESYVDDPIYLDVFLMAPEAQEGTYLLSDAAVPLSNAIKFEITP